jgi:hypothetical protein
MVFSTYSLGLAVLGVGLFGVGGKLLGETRVLAVLEGALAVGLTLRALVLALALVAHLSLALNTLGARRSAPGHALLGLLVAG